jgi:short-subunit dehydrogenase
VSERTRYKSDILAGLDKIGIDAQGRNNGEEISMLILAQSCMVHGKFECLALKDIKTMLDYNVYHTGILLRMLVRKFYHRAFQGKKSAIITLSSSMSMRVAPGSVVYSASKAFVTYFTMALGQEFHR